MKDLEDELWWIISETGSYMLDLIGPFGFHELRPIIGEMIQINVEEIIGEKIKRANSGQNIC